MNTNRLAHAGWALAIAGTLLSGCAHYTPEPLASGAPLAPDIAGLEAAPAPGPLTVEQVVALALANNPDLKATRLRRGIVRAQRLQAGILPNPTLGGALLPLISGPGSVPAWTIGLTQNVKALVTYRTRLRAAGDAVRQVDADIVWQEWQVAGQARQLAADLILGARSRPTYVATYDLLADRNAKLEKALAGGNATLATVAPDRVALQAARSALNGLDQRQLGLMHQLDALLGLSPEAAVPLASSVDLPPFDAAVIRAELATLPDRRPDLIALRMGYAQSDEQVREAILSQFPDLVLGAQSSSDNAKVINGGPIISVGLPVFDRNQGGVALAQATRGLLHAAYSARLVSATGQVQATLAEMEQLSAQLAAVERDLPTARQAADRAAQAFAGSNLDERAYVDLVTIRFAKERELMTLQLALLDRQIALQTLIGAGLPAVGSATDSGGAGRS